jgi:hypothetical protein
MSYNELRQIVFDIAIHFIALIQLGTEKACRKPTQNHKTEK